MFRIGRKCFFRRIFGFGGEIQPFVINDYSANAQANQMAAIQTAISKAEKIGLDIGNLRRLESAGGIRAIRNIRRLETKGTYN